MGPQVTNSVALQHTLQQYFLHFYHLKSLKSNKHWQHTLATLLSTLVVSKRRGLHGVPKPQP